VEKKTTPLALWVMERGNVAKEELVEQQFVKPYVQMDEMHIMEIPKTPFLQTRLYVQNFNGELI